MSKPSAKKKQKTVTPAQKPTDSPPPITHIMVSVADAQRMIQEIGEVPCKFGVAWVLDVLKKAPAGTITATRPAKKPAPPG